MKPYSATCVACGQTRTLTRRPQSDTCKPCTSRRNGEQGAAAPKPRAEAPKRAVKPPQPVVSFEQEIAVENAQWLLSQGERIDAVARRLGLSVSYVARLLADKGIEQLDLLAMEETA